ncbi:lysoplasmalogenase [Aquimarina sp. 2201CG14-23]|uniref:lysoplasmalogenase n=1 Tax=Aquimarina mycalae TaxID=3040073 RepID=UPI0024781233|nr:lysoplasmalogenase [Aquimarina sp. 2201CG14-23]MDH7447895.1 lysoplasmalogenase [Aquimarina sp. 2201CG14-23]
MNLKTGLRTNVIYFVMCYTAILILDLICGSIEELGLLRYITKPSVIGSLIVFLILNRSKLKKEVFRLMVLALFFSLLGDILLLFDKIHSLFFIGGLVSFLSAHVLYVLVFAKKRNPNKRNLIFLIITLCYGVLLFFYLKDGLAELLIPVIIYMIVILTMSNMSYLREGKVSVHSYQLVFVGSLFFMLSDSLLAINMFYKPLYLGNILIMSTYAIAQLLIVYGVLNQGDKV